MARIRTIKPEFFSSEDIVALTPWARLLYISLWCEADREGRMTWKPGTFKLRYFPGDEVNVENISVELLGRGLVVLYGKGLAYIPKFKDHQHINPREAASVLPAPDEISRVKHASARVSDTQGGREGKEGKERASLTRTGFEQFWTAYPKKVSKGQAEKAWAKLSPDEQLLSRILSAVGRAKTRVDWLKDAGQFVPYPATWLGARGWEDADAVDLPLADGPDFSKAIG